MIPLYELASRQYTDIIDIYLELPVIAFDLTVEVWKNKDDRKSDKASSDTTIQHG